MPHLEPGELVDLARDLLPEGAAPRLREHLAECARCRGSYDRLAALVHVARAPEPPEQAVRYVKALASPPPESTMTLARAIFDNLLEPLPAGIRGTVYDRHLLFEAGDWAVDVRLDQRPGRTSLTGQVAHVVSSRPCAGIPVLARSADGVLARSLTGTWGEFTLDCGDRSPSRVEILVPAPAIAIDLPTREA